MRTGLSSRNPQTRAMTHAVPSRAAGKRREVPRRSSSLRTRCISVITTLLTRYLRSRVRGVSQEEKITHFDLSFFRTSLIISPQTQVCQTIAGAWICSNLPKFLTFSYIREKTDFKIASKFVCFFVCEIRRRFFKFAYFSAKKPKARIFFLCIVTIL